MGHFGQKSEGALLRTDRGRAKKAHRRKRALGSHRCGGQYRAHESVKAARPAMNRFRAFLYRLRGFFRRRTIEAELSEELHAHLDGLIERNLVAGMSPD